MPTATLEDLGHVGLLYADLSGFSQLVYQCIDDPARRERLALAMQRLLHHDADQHPDTQIEGYAGDGFLALCTGPKPARQAYRLAVDLHQRFDADIRSLLGNLGFRVNVSLRTALHVGPVYRLPLHPPAQAAPDTMPSHAAPPRRVTLSDAVVVAARISTSQTCRRFGLAASRQAFKRLLLAGGQDVREPDEIIQDRNQYPEPIPVYRLRDDEHPA